MADKIKKFLAKLSPKELQLIRALTAQLIANDFKGLDIAQLKGDSKLYRARKGNFRVVFYVSKIGEIKIVNISRRDERTYKGY